MFQIKFYLNEKNIDVKTSIFELIQTEKDHLTL